MTGKVVLWCFFFRVKWVKKSAIHLFMSKSQFRTWSFQMRFGIKLLLLKEHVKTIKKEAKSRTKRCKKCRVIVVYWFKSTISLLTIQPKDMLGIFISRIILLYIFASVYITKIQIRRRNLVQTNRISIIDIFCLLIFDIAHLH